MAKKQFRFNIVLSGGTNDGMQKAIVDGSDDVTIGKSLHDRISEQFQTITSSLRRVLNDYELLWMAYDVVIWTNKSYLTIGVVQSTTLTMSLHRT